MKFMIPWELHPDKRHDAFTAFAEMDLEEYQTQQGSSVKLIGRWHDLANGTGVAICETDDAEALTLWLMKWHAICDFEIVPVLDDEEAHVAAKKAAAS